jgi:predicted phosphodiesterase
MIRFAAFTDLHYDHIYDGVARINEFIDTIKSEQLDFIISLGDLCYPTEKNKWILEKLRSINIPVYFTVGNHDTDQYTLNDVQKYLGVDTLNNSFTVDNTKFLLLNSCYMKKNHIDYAYCKKNFEKESTLYPVIPDFEVKWLCEEMSSKEYNYVLFSHHSLVNDFAQRGIVNRQEILDILSTRKTILCMNGHDHGQECNIIQNIPYYTLNSMSYIWHGLKEVYSYNKDIHKQFPFLKDMILYKNALHCIVEIGDHDVNIFGMKSDYQSITPENVGILNRVWNGVSIQPNTLNFKHTIPK